MVSVNPLSNPKGMRLLCELCQGPAFLQCPDCRVTYYCSAEHQRSDLESVHPQLCPLLVPLRASQPVISNEDERRRSAEHSLQLRSHILELTTRVAERLLGAGRPGQALPAAVHSLRFTIGLHGLRSPQMVPAYLLLAEASIGIGNLPHAEQYLSQAHWAVLKNNDCSQEVLARLHRNYGLLFSAKGNLVDALTHLANDVYYSSCAYGTCNVRTSPGYFHMANVFLQQKKMDTADSMYAEVTRIWQVLLSRMLKGQLNSPVAGGKAPRWAEGAEEDCFDETQGVQAVQMLNQISDIRERAFKREPAKIAHNLHTLAMLYFVILDVPKACELSTKALLMVKDLPNQDQAEAIKAFLAVAESKLPPCK